MAIPFIRELGIVLESATNGESRLVLDTAERHTNSRSFVHGGVLMTLLDVAMASAGRSAEQESPPGVTVTMNTTFLRAAAPGRLVANGRCLHRTRSQSFCEAEILDADGNALAKATGIFKHPAVADPDAPSSQSTAAEP